MTSVANVKALFAPGLVLTGIGLPIQAQVIDILEGHERGEGAFTVVAGGFAFFGHHFESRRESVIEIVKPANSLISEDLVGAGPIGSKRRRSDSR